MDPLHQPQDKQKEKASDAIRTAWNVFQKETWENRGKRNGRNYVQMNSRELEIIFRDNARRRWRSVLKDHRMDIGAWIMTDTDKEEVSTLFGWNWGQMIDACEEDWGIFVDPEKLKPDITQSVPGSSTQSVPGPPPVGRTQTFVQPQLPTQQPQLQDLRAEQSYMQPSEVKFLEHPVYAQAQGPIVQPRPASARPSQLRASQADTRPSRVKFSEHPMHAQAQLRRHSLDPSQMAQSRSSSGQSLRFPPPRQSRPYSSALLSDEEEIDENDDEEGSDSDDYDEEVDSDNPIKEDDEEKRTNGVINSMSGTLFSLTEPFFGEVSWAEMKAKSPKTALFAEKSANVWVEKCQKKAAQNSRLIAEYRLAGCANMGVEEVLILEVHEYGRRAQEKWVKAVNAEWERNLRRAQPHVPEQTAVHDASNIQHNGERLGHRERPQHMDNFRSGELRDSGASSSPRTKDGRSGRVPRDIFKTLESFVRERNVAGDDLSLGEPVASHPDGRPTPKASPLIPKITSQLDPVIAETSRLPPPASSTLVPSGSHPMHTKLDPVIGGTSHRPPLTMHRSGIPVPFRSHHASWYDIDEEAILAKEKTELKPWDYVPHEYEQPELSRNDTNSVRSSVFMLAEEVGGKYRQDEEEMSYNDDESDWDSDISSESSITMTEASVHFLRSDQPWPSNMGQSVLRTVNAGGTNSDQPSVRRSAWRTI